MNRLFHLKETYLRNIDVLKSNKNVEFILLNYSSKDNIDEWVKNNLKKHIDSGLVSYYKIENQNYWVAAHAKNIAHKLAYGEILGNLDCDNFIVEGLYEELIRLFDKNVIVCCEPKDNENNIGTCGMIFCKNKDFYSVNGYDEEINLGWGEDDRNFQFRCRMQNDLELVILNKNLTKCIGHTDEIRTKNCQIKNNCLYDEKIYDIMVYIN